MGDMEEKGPYGSFFVLTSLCLMVLCLSGL